MVSAEEIILYHDDQLLVANKPSGLSTLVDGWHPEAPHLAGILRERFQPLWTVHRLDRETSGVILFARTAEAHRSLNQQLQTRQVEKIYHALVLGNPGWEEKEVRRFLRADGDRRHRTVEDPVYGKPAVTQLRVLERFGDVSLVEALPKTGRTHQIRAHLLMCSYPIAGDNLYGSPDNRFERMMLHAFSLRILHPATGNEVVYEAPYPIEFINSLHDLRNRSG